MLELVLKITLNGVAYTVHAKVAEFIAFERQFNTPITALSADGTRFEWLVFLAHAALKRSGIEVAPSYDDQIFLSSIDSLEPVDEEAVVPTEAVPPTV